MYRSESVINLFCPPSFSMASMSVSTGVAGKLDVISVQLCGTCDEPGYHSCLKPVVYHSLHSTLPSLEFESHFFLIAATHTDNGPKT